MKVVGKIVGVTLTVTVGAFVAGWMFEAGRDAYHQDKRDVMKEQAQQKAKDIKETAISKFKEFRKKLDI